MRSVPSGPCRLCPRRCRARRDAGEIGECKVSGEITLAAASIHRGEEPPISGQRGSATFFLTGCPLHCIYCQNYPISQLGNGTTYSVEDVAEKMLLMERKGAHNINLVTGSQWAVGLMNAVQLARERDLQIPVVWNTSGYESRQTLALLDGFIDIYLTDLRYADEKISKELSGADDYFEIACCAARVMLDQVGHLVTDQHGVAKRGLIVRHMVLPRALSGTEKILSFIEKELGRETHVSFMCQYFPAYKAHKHPLVGRPLLPDEYSHALKILDDIGLENGWRQDMNLQGHS